MSLDDIISKIEGGGYVLKVPLHFCTGIKGYEVSLPYVRLHKNGGLVLDPDFKWDGATCAPDIDIVIIPSAPHDALYGLIRAGLIPRSAKNKADSTFYNEIKAQNYMPKPRGVDKLYVAGIADIYYTGVRWFGFFGL